MKQNQERCDGCGKWVNDCSLVWLHGTYDDNDKCVCKDCYVKHEKDNLMDDGIKKFMELLKEMGATDIEFDEESETLYFTYKEKKVQLFGVWYNDNNSGNNAGLAVNFDLEIYREKTKND